MPFAAAAEEAAALVASIFAAISLPLFTLALPLFWVHLFCSSKAGGHLVEKTIDFSGE